MPVMAEDLAQQIENHFHIYQIKPEKRRSEEKVEIKGDTATIFYWENLANRKPDEAICNAFGWMMLGRTSYGKGAQDAFERYPTLQQIEIGFFDVDFGTKKGTRRAEILPDAKPVPYLKIAVRRDSLMRKTVDKKEIKQMLADRRCPEIGKKYIDSISLNDDYMKRKK